MKITVHADRPAMAAAAAPEAADAAAAYFRITCWSLPGLFVLIFMFMLVRGTGDARTPFIFTIFAILVGLALSAGASTLLLHSDPGLLLAAGLVAQGIARSSLMTVAMLALVETRGVGERHAGTAGGLFFSAAEVGGAGGPIMLGVLYDATGGFAAGLWMLTVLAALMLLGALRLRALEARAA